MKSDRAGRLGMREGNERVEVLEPRAGTFAMSAMAIGVQNEYAAVAGQSDPFGDRLKDLQIVAADLVYSTRQHLRWVRREREVGNAMPQVWARTAYRSKRSNRLLENEFAVGTGGDPIGRKCGFQPKGPWTDGCEAVWPAIRVFGTIGLSLGEIGSRA